MSEKLLSLSDVIELTGLSKTSIWRAQKEGTFPASYSLSPGRVAWKASEIERWIEERVPRKQNKQKHRPGHGG